MAPDESSDRSGFWIRLPFVTPDRTTHSNRLFVFLLACVIFCAGRAPFLGQWDSFDYLKQIVTHRLSDLGFGRPVFIGFNVVLWEAFHKILRLAPLQVEGIVMAEVILTGALGVLIFARLGACLLRPAARPLAMPALLLSPMYALYSGFIMTEVPMVVTLMAAAVILWPSDSRQRMLRDIGGGVVFGLAVGMREQAITMGAAYLWILWCRRQALSMRVRSLATFGVAAVLVILAPMAMLYFHDPSAFEQRLQIWLRVIPTGREHFWGNMQASLLWTLAICPAAWLAVFGAWIRHRIIGPMHEPNQGDKPAGSGGGTGWIHAPFMGVFCCLVLPVCVLWRDADVQIHPRYALIALPAALLLCVSLYARWAPSARAAVTWVVIHLVVFGIAQIGIQPFRHIQFEKREYTRLVRASVPGEALLIPGGYSPIMDYYRALGDRPQWRILWSGWGWQSKTAEAVIREAWSHQIPVYLCQGPAGWLYFEDELLDLYFIFHRSRRDEVAPNLFRVYPDW